VRKNGGFKSDEKSQHGKNKQKDFGTVKKCSYVCVLIEI
jgi:hypothetical protein